MHLLITSHRLSSTSFFLSKRQSRAKSMRFSEYTRLTLLRFYAPWCGHCQNLKPAYEKAATSLAGLAKVAAVNCDEDVNKPFCGTMGITGFPTIKIVRPGKKPGKPSVEDYKGPRTAKGIVDSVIDKINNHVKRVNTKEFDDWLSEDENKAKAILFTEKGATTPLIRAIAIDFLGSIDVAQVRSKETAVAERYGISDFPKLVLLPGGDQEPIIYDGEMKKPAMVEFLSQITPPNPDPAPKGGKSAKSEDKKRSASASSAFSKASAAHEAADEQSAKTEQMSETLENAEPTESPDPNVAGPPPVAIPDDLPPMIPRLETPEEVENACLQQKSSTCVLILLPEMKDEGSLLPEATRDALLGLVDIQHKYKQRSSNLFPFYSIPSTNTIHAILKGNLGLPANSDVDVIAINRRRNWWRRYSKSVYGLVELEEWIDAIRMGDGEKLSLNGVFADDDEEEQAAEEPIVEEPAIQEEEEKQEEGFADEDIHDEL